MKRAEILKPGVVAKLTPLRQFLQNRPGELTCALGWQMTPEAESCAPYLKALAGKTRWRIVHRLLSGSQTVGEIATSLKATEYNVSRHVRVLRDAGIIKAVKRGKHLHCEIIPAFRRRIGHGGKALDLGCCVFRFEDELK